MSARTIKISLVLAFLFTPAFSFASVSITEVFYSPQSKSWVEVYNDSDSSVDLTKYKILDSGAAVNGHSISSISGDYLAAHGYAVIAKDPTSVSAATIYKASLGAKTSGDTISLKDDSGNIVDSFTFTSSMGGAGDGNSLQKTDSGGWIAAAPTPGATNSSTPAPVTDSSSSSDTNPSGSGDNSGDGSGSGHATTVTILSTHYSYLPLSAFDERENLSVGAGRTRLGSVGSPMAFKAETSTNAGAQFIWNFGDGSLGSGERIDHTYKYPGDYVVVLNVTNGVDQAVARTQVKIVDPELSVVNASPAVIQIVNNSKYEVNLYGWQISADGKNFAFPQDTIILPQGKVNFDSAITGLSPNSKFEVSLINSTQTQESNTQLARAGNIDPAAVALLARETNALQAELDDIARSQSIEAYSEPREWRTEAVSFPDGSGQVTAPVLALDGLAKLSSATTSTSTVHKKPSAAYSWYLKVKHFFGFR